MIRRLLAVITTLLLLLTLSTVALAQKKGKEKETPEQQQAKALFQQGISLSDDGKWAEALASFQQSDQLVPSAPVRFNIGATLRALGRYVEAKNTLDAVLTDQQKFNPPPKPALLEEVRKLLGEVLQKSWSSRSGPCPRRRTSRWTAPRPPRCPTAGSSSTPANTCSWSAPKVTRPPPWGAPSAPTMWS